jgi:site-specific DNA-methyltransferase (adenine-specific)
MENKIKKYGEVLTPVSLVNEMLDTLPKEVWTNPDLKWLDPAAGRNMIFPIEIYKRLMVGLSDIITDTSVRDNHIWDNMLYMVEIQKSAVEEGIIEINKTRSEFNKQ